MGLKFAWSVMGYKCCHSCIYCQDIPSERIIKDIQGNVATSSLPRTFKCNIGVKLIDNDINLKNSLYCINHRFNKSFKKKKRLTKNKIIKIQFKRIIYWTVTKRYPDGN